MKAKVWTTVFAVLALWMVGAGIASAVHAHRHGNAIAKANDRAHFYRVIASQDDGSEPTVDNKLALALRSADLNRFRGDSNAYGGITEAIGVDPFDNSCGVECGPLTAQMRSNVSQARGGGVQSLLEADQPADSAGPSWRLPGTLLVLWLLVAMAARFGPALRRWRRSDAVKARYASEYQLAQKLDQAVRALPAGDPQRENLINLRRGLQAALNERAFGQVNTANRQALKRLGDEAKLTLDAFEEGNQAL